jgi:hypothetical protein
MNRATEVRLSKLEADVPAPASPFDVLTIDELSVFLLEEYRSLWRMTTCLRKSAPMRNGTSRHYQTNHRNRQFRLGMLGQAAWLR